MRTPLVQFVTAFAVFVVVFFALDLAIMKLHGLNLIFQQ